MRKRLLKNRVKWLIDQLPHRVKARKRRDRETVMLYYLNSGCLPIPLDWMIKWQEAIAQIHRYAAAPRVRHLIQDTELHCIVMQFRGHELVRMEILIIASITSILSTPIINVIMMIVFSVPILIWPKGKDIWKN